MRDRQTKISRQNNFLQQRQESHSQHSERNGSHYESERGHDHGTETEYELPEHGFAHQIGSIHKVSRSSPRAFGPKLPQQSRVVNYPSHNWLKESLGKKKEDIFIEETATGNFFLHEKFDFDIENLLTVLLWRFF